MAPRLTPASFATSASDARETPWAWNTRSAASSICTRVACASSLVLLAICHLLLPCSNPSVRKDGREYAGSFRHLQTFTYVSIFLHRFFPLPSYPSPLGP